MRTWSDFFWHFFFIFNESKLKSFRFCQLGGHDVCLFSQTPDFNYSFYKQWITFFLFLYRKRNFRIFRKSIFISGVVTELQFQNRICRHYFCFFVCLGFSNYFYVWLMTATVLLFLTWCCSFFSFAFWWPLLFPCLYV